MVLVQNWSFLHVFILGNRGQENVFYNILERKNAFLCCKNKKFKKLKNWDFSKGVSPWFWFKIGHFSNFLLLCPKLTILHVFISGKRDQENLFYDILERKNAFLGCINKKFKNSKYWDFSKGVSPWFWSKIGHFYMFLF